MPEHGISQSPCINIDYRVGTRLRSLAENVDLGGIIKIARRNATQDGTYLPETPTSGAMEVFKVDPGTSKDNQSNMKGYLPKGKDPSGRRAVLKKNRPEEESS
ncbi:hypothetical protein Zmor_023682 [Zophobas morio]|uniref:Uncharacterized protein n=1 Tax=Zophobas morio TaxID=2755281 RepID=A0AA38M7C0_9CUCU|nr:hypothetical protein Zmor_023682 [Zophobas morio]